MILNRVNGVHELVSLSFIVLNLASVSAVTTKSENNVIVIVTGTCTLIFILIYNAGILGNQGSTAQLTYRVPLGVDSSLIHCIWSHDGSTMTIDGSKYVKSGSRSLLIHNIVGTDEGTYTCQYNYRQQVVSADVATVYVIGELY